MNLKNIGLLTCLLTNLAFRVELSLPKVESYSPVSNRQTPQVNQEIEHLFAATNQVRAAKRRIILQQNPKLMAAAQQYAELMAARDEMSHTIGGFRLAQKAQRVGYAYRSLSENIALNTVLDGRFVVLEQWMKSKGHRQNLLASEVSQIGIGIAGPSKRGNRYYYCQIFGSPLSERAP